MACRAFHNGFAGGRRNHFLFDVPDFGVLVFPMFMLAVSVLAMSCVVFGVVLGPHPQRIPPDWPRVPLRLPRLLPPRVRNFSGLRFFCFFRSNFGLFFRLFFVEIRRRRRWHRLPLLLCFFVFGLDETEASAAT